MELFLFASDTGQCLWYSDYGAGMAFLDDAPNWRYVNCFYFQPAGR